MKSKIFSEVWKVFFSSKKSYMSNFFDQFSFIFCSRADWVLLPHRNHSLCLLIWLWYNPRSSRSISDDFFFVFDFLSVRIIRTESLRRIFIEKHHYPATGVVSGYLGPGPDLILRFQGDTTSQHAILDIRTAFQIERLVENLSLNDGDRCLEDVNLVRFIVFMQKYYRVVIRGRILRRISCRKPRNGWSVCASTIPYVLYVRAESQISSKIHRNWTWMTPDYIVNSIRRHNKRLAYIRGCRPLLQAYLE